MIFTLCAMESYSIDFKRIGKPRIDILRAQAISMQHLVGFSRNPPIESHFCHIDVNSLESLLSVCEWHGVECSEHAIVTKIDWQDSTDCALENFLSQCRCLSPDWIPNTVRQFGVQGAYINASLRTLLFPREAVILSFVDCELYGKLDFGNLPKDLKRLDLSINLFDGTVFLTSLPKNIELIDLRYNGIGCVYLRNSSLPESLVNVFVCNGKNKIPIKNLEEGKADRRVQVLGSGPLV